MVDLGEAKQYLGMHIEQNRDACTIYLNQTRYITKILECFGMQDCKGISTSMEAAVRGALQRMFERKLAVEQPVKAKINVQVRIKIRNA